jgi:FkbM family methyltransferase
VRQTSDKPAGGFALHWWRLERSVGRRWREWRLPRGFERLGTRYGGWWIYAPAVGDNPLLVDCGLGNDISFPVAFLQRFGGQVVGVDPNPAALAYVAGRRPEAMQVRPAAFWSEAGRELSFHLPRPLAELPQGADGVSGSLLGSHSYAGTSTLAVRTTSLGEILAQAERTECDVLKLDIEGAEYDVLAALCQNGEIRRTRQLLVEYHHHCTDRTLADTESSIARVEAAGFRVAHTEDRNCVFLRNG